MDESISTDLYGGDRSFSAPIVNKVETEEDAVIDEEPLNIPASMLWANTGVVGISEDDEIQSDVTDSPTNFSRAAAISIPVVAQAR